jgi:hypothetical protein
MVPLLCWGDRSAGGTAPLGLSGVTQIYSTSSAFAALKGDGTVVCWGDGSAGGNTPPDLKNVIQIFSTTYAFAALKNDGTVVSWGDALYGGSAPADLSAVVGFANPFTDDRLTLPTITLAVTSTSVTEDGTGLLTYTFTRTSPTTSALSVNYTVSGTATLGTDYTGIADTPVTKTVTFSAGSSTAVVTVDPTADSTIEPDETVELTLVAGVGYDVGTQAAVVGTITNDDFPRVSLGLSLASVPEDGASNLVYTFTRTGPTLSALTINYTVAGTATLGSDYTGIAGTPATKTVTFLAGSSTATVTVDPTPDDIAEEDETVALRLVDGAGYVVDTSAAVVGIITNDDLPKIYFAVSPQSVTEDGADKLVYGFLRTGPNTSALTVNYTVAGTATPGSDFTGIVADTSLPRSVTFSAGLSVASVTIAPIADNIIEPDETVQFTLAPGPGYTIGTTTAVVGTIVNDDFPVVTLAISPASVLEDGAANLVYSFPVLVLRQLP